MAKEGRAGTIRPYKEDWDAGSLRPHLPQSQEPPDPHPLLAQAPLTSLHRHGVWLLQENAGGFLRGGRLVFGWGFCSGDKIGGRGGPRRVAAGHFGGGV